MSLTHSDTSSKTEYALRLAQRFQAVWDDYTCGEICREEMRDRCEALWRVADGNRVTDLVLALLGPNGGRL